LAQAILAQVVLAQVAFATITLNLREGSPVVLSKMAGKAVVGTSLTVAAALFGTEAVRAFVPATPGPMAETVGSPSLRGIGAASDMIPEQGGAPSASSSALPAGVVAVGALALSAAGRSGQRGRTMRRAEAATAVASPDVEAPAPPPPFNPALQMGVTDPLGYFDPLGLCKVGEEENFRKLRVAEMKHGRVAMMAAIGAVFQHYVQIPGFSDVPKGIWAPTSAPGSYGFVALFIISGVFELLLWKDDASKSVDSIGDYGNPLQLGAGQPLGESEDMRNRELNNGRAAMFAALGIIVAELYSGKDAMQQFGFS